MPYKLIKDYHFKQHKFAKTISVQTIKSKLLIPKTVKAQQIAIFTFYNGF